MTKILRGIVHGRTIELDEDTGLNDGHQVEVILRAKVLPGPPPGWKPGSSDTAAGMMASAWTSEDDQVFEELHRQRKHGGRRELPE